jgi:quercetin dioxygenase-like cupin family protein
VASLSLAHEDELLFLFVLDGEATLVRAHEPDQALVAGDAVTIPPGLPTWLRPSPTLRLLQARVRPGC